ncbi:retrovirus-related pol polyprotein from transposon TNT 1-94 [Tanacetum coccineum]
MRYGPRDFKLKPTISAVPTLKVDTKWKEKFFNHANNVRLEEPKKARENTDAPIIEDWVSDDEEEVESTPKVEKKIPTATKKESVNTVKPSRRTVRYAEMYRSQRPRGNQRSWNGQKTDQLGCNFVFNNKACFICGDFDHIQYYCPNAYKHMVPRAVLMKTGLKTVKNAKPLSTVRSVNTARPVSTARFFALCQKKFQLNEKGFVGSGCSRTMSGKYIITFQISKEFDGRLCLLLVEEQWRIRSLRKKVSKENTSCTRDTSYNGVAERKNRTLIEAARTMLADSKLPTTFWAEAVSTACYVQNRVLVVKPHNKTPYELFKGIKPAIGFMKPFGCHVTILNTLDKLGKFDGKVMKVFSLLFGIFK